ncbi:MAG: hypothetical protein ABH824_03075 [Nanoarchaeota archaeon]
MKKRNLFFVILMLMVLLSNFTLAQEKKGIGDLVSGVLDIGRLEFLFGSGADNQVIGFIRILMAVLVFSILYFGLSVIPNLPRNIAITIGILLALLTALFMPKQVLVMFGETYATIFALIIIGGPIAGVMALCFFTPTPNRGVAFVKFLAVCFTMWLISQINVWADALAGATGVI